MAGHMWVFGGYWRYGHCLGDLHGLDLQTLEWRVHSHPFSPDARTSHAACAISDNEWLIFGGFNGAHYLNDLHVMTVRDGEVSWHRGPVADGAAPPPRQHCSMVRVNDKVYVFGGYSHGKAVGDLWILDLSGWKKGAGRMVWQPSGGIDMSHAPSRRDGHVAFSFQDRYMVVFGGYDSQVYSLDTADRRWLPPESFDGQPRYRRLMHRSPDTVPAALFGERSDSQWGIVVGGVDDYQNTLLSDAWALDYVHRRWIPLPPAVGCRAPPVGGLCGGGLALHLPEGDGGCAVLLLWGGERDGNDKHGCLYVAAPRGAAAGPAAGDATLNALAARCAESAAGMPAGAGNPCRACRMCTVQ
eukprot:TRINITY_DN30824_c0_g1_i1.p1 TRINITY_DN30824_c0_g1~~TRINITY_DN30824_c0_g1_i1.p1  ORF type:complete len:409 (+),score=130.06 TRINITY_DN30824_c0_g1_i1:161-1228(+)